MKVSIIVPVYNTEQYLQQCLDSIRKQSYENIEVILIDDGATDRSGEICDSYAREDARFIVIHNTNHGVSYSRNCGLKRATGEYISFIDSDDAVDEQYISRLMEAIEKYAADVSCCSMTCCYDDGRREAVHLWDTDQVFLKRKILNYAAGKEKNFVGYVWGKLYKRSVILDNGIFFDEEVHICEDSLFAYQVLSRAAMAVVIPDCLYDYRIRQNSATREAFVRPDRMQSKLRAFELALEIAEQLDNEKFTQNIYTVLFESAIVLALSLSAKNRADEIDTELLKKMKRYFRNAAKEDISMKIKLFYRVLRIHKKTALWVAKRYLEKKDQ